MPMTVGDQVGRIIGGPAGHDGDAPERRGRRGGRALVRSSRSTPRATGSSTSAGTFPPCATSTRRSRSSRSSSARTTEAIVDAIDERTLLVPISHVLFKTGEIQDDRADHPARARGRRARDPRLLPVRRDRPLRRHGAGRRLRGRRLGQVALTAAPGTAGSTSGPTSPSGSSRRSRAGRRTSGRSASRRRWTTRRARPGSSRARRTCPRSTPRRRATT